MTWPEGGLPHGEHPHDYGTVTRTPQELAQVADLLDEVAKRLAFNERNYGRSWINETADIAFVVEPLLDRIDALAEAGERAREALREVSNAYGCFAGCTGALPGAQTGTHTPSCRKARAALGEES